MSKVENIVEFPNLKAIEEEAALWVARLDGRETLPADEMKALREWVSVSPQHKEALERMSSLWGGLDCLDDLNYIESDPALTRTPLRHQARWWTAGAVAASFMLATIGMFSLGPSRQDAFQSGRYATVVGEQETVSLADGSTIILNTNSEVTVDLSDLRRSITLLRGEAHFDVASDADRPFLVYANDGIVKAVGTAFTVQLRKNAVEVTVSEGVVALISRPQAQLIEDESLETVDDLTPLAALTVGQSAVFAETVESIHRITDDALDRKLLWREGFIAFAGEPLSSVVADVSRYTDVIIEIDDPALEKLPIGGYFKVGEVEDMFDSLEATFGIRAERVSANKVKLSRAS